LILPVVVLSIGVIPYLYRLVRASTIDVLESEYIHMARLKGLSKRRILYRHALPNALIPGIQASALVLAFLLGGQIVVEYLFAYPGIGTTLLDAIRNRDLPMIQAISLIYATAYIICNLGADVLTIVATPRLRTGGG
jgi:peptide/nickel transport system permease protein